MLPFAIDWKIPYCDCSHLLNNQSFSGFNINEEWSLEWSIDEDRTSISVAIRRKSTSENASVSGRLELRKNGQFVTCFTFSELMRSENSFMYLIHMTSIRPKFISNQPYDLQGYINVVSSVENCTRHVRNAHCISPKEKCSLLRSLLQLSNDFQRLLDSQSTCSPDVYLKCGSDLLPAHKVVLSARSTVFEALFTNPLTEKTNNEVNITDIDASVLRTLMVYIYTGKTPNLTIKSASDLLLAGDKYRLQDLKRVCCDFLKEKISFKNVLWILVLGDLHSNDLRSFALDYICTKCTDFSAFEKTQEWITLRLERPVLGMDVLTSLVKWNQKSKG